MNECAAMVYARRGRAFVVPESLTVDGFWVAEATCFVADVASPRTVTQHIDSALRLSRTRVPTPPPSKRLDVELLAHAGVKSFSTFMKGATAVRVSGGDEGILLTPMRNAGSKGGFVFTDADAFPVQDPADLPAAIGMALAAAT